MKRLLLLFTLLITTSLAFGQATGKDFANFTVDDTLVASTSVDGASRINIIQTTANITISVPPPTNTTTKVVEPWIVNKGTVPFTLIALPDISGCVIDTGKFVILKWIGARYAVSGSLPLEDTINYDSTYIRLDGTSPATTGNIPIGNNLGLRWNTKLTLEGVNTTSDASRYLAFYSSNNASSEYTFQQMYPSFWGARYIGSGSNQGFLTLDNQGIGLSYGTGTGFGYFKTTNLTTSRNYQLPNASGTIALTSDIVATDTTALMRKAGGVFTGNVNGVTPTQLTYLNSLTSNVQTQLDSKIGLTSISAIAPITYNNTTGTIDAILANGSTNGYISSTDWNTFNNKAGLGSNQTFTGVNRFGTLSGTEIGSLKILDQVAGTYTTAVESTSSGVLSVGAAYTSVQFGASTTTTGNAIFNANVSCNTFRNRNATTLNITTQLTAGSTNDIVISSGAVTSGGGTSGSTYINTGTSTGTRGGGLGLFTTSGSFGGGVNTLFMANMVTAPTSNPTGGFVNWADAGNWRMRSSGGGVTTIGTAGVSMETVGQGLLIKEGTNATLGRATMVGGTVTVNTTKVTANSEIFVTIQSPSGTLGTVYVSARTAGTSFTITSTSALDTSVVAWFIVEPN